MPQASALVTLGFIALPLLLAAAFVLGTAWAGRRTGQGASSQYWWALGTALGALGWLTLTWALAASGTLRRFDMAPPPLVVLLLSVVALGVGIGCSPLGTRLVRGLPLAALVGAQVFRLPLELLMHEAYVEGLMPVQMSYSGMNFDILTGISAGILAPALAGTRVPRWIVGGWNLLGFALLVNIVTIAVLSTPLFRWFGDDRLNTWVTYPPYVWLPAVMVLAALTGHILVLRKLRAETRGQ